MSPAREKMRKILDGHKRLIGFDRRPGYEALLAAIDHVGEQLASQPASWPLTKLWVMAYREGERVRREFLPGQVPTC